MRLCYLATLYDTYVDHIYGKSPGLDEADYERQKQQFDEDGFSWNGAWEPAFATRGYFVASFYANVVPLQRAWLRESKGGWPTVGGRLEIAARQVKAVAPDVLFVDDLRTFSSAWLTRIREECSSLRWIIGFTGVEFDGSATLRQCDLVLTPAEHMRRRFRELGARAYLLRHAFNPAVLDRLPLPGSPIEQVFFSGNIFRSTGSHIEREKLLLKMAAEVPMAFYCPQADTSPLDDFVETGKRAAAYYSLRAAGKLGFSREQLRRLPMIGAAANWPRAPLRQVNPLLRPYMRPPVYGMEMFALMRRHMIAFNSHIELARNEAGNCRMFEATGSGACLLTDMKSNLAELFVPDAEVVVYSTADECVEKAKWLMSRPDARRSIAAAGQRRTMREHTFAHRAERIDELLEELRRR